MSVKVMGLVWDHYPNGGGEFLTALCLADHADHDGANIFPAVSRVAKKTQQGHRTVQRHMAIMRASGWLVVVKVSNGAHGQTTIYRIPIECIPLDVVGRVPKLHPPNEITKSYPQDYPQGCQMRHPRVPNRVSTGATAVAHKLGLPVIKSTRQGAQLKTLRRPVREKKDKIKNWKPKERGDEKQ